jgi:putative flippase GtrA
MSIPNKRLTRFLFAGSSAVATDTLVYFLLLNFLPPSIAKTISFLTGTFIAFIINKRWTFEKPGRPLSEGLKFAILYLLTLGVNVGVNHSALFLIPGANIQAFCTATCASTAVNLIWQKTWNFGVNVNVKSLIETFSSSEKFSFAKSESLLIMSILISMIVFF